MTRRRLWGFTLVFSKRRRGICRREDCFDQTSGSEKGFFPLLPRARNARGSYSGCCCCKAWFFTQGICKPTDSNNEKLKKQCELISQPISGTANSSSNDAYKSDTTWLVISKKGFSKRHYDFLIVVCQICEIRIKQVQSDPTEVPLIPLFMWLQYVTCSM